jgi:hypothetical protein
MKSYNREEEKVQLVMLDKCKNYFQLRKPQAKYLTPKHSRHEISKRPQTSGPCMNSLSSSFIEQLQGVMNHCDFEGREIKEDMNLFTFYCRMMDRRLEGIRNTI